MDDRLNAEKKEQLLKRVKQCLDEDTLNVWDWMKIYDVLLEACERESAAVYESMLADSINEGDAE